MSKSCFWKEIMNRVMLVSIIGFVCVSSSIAQETIAEKIDYAKALFGGYMSSSKDEQMEKIVSFYEKCTKEQKDSILSYMVRTIKDSLTVDNKQFAMNYIDYYRIIANPDDSYLGSLVVTEGRYYYDQMNASRLSELSDYLNKVATESKLDYSSEISELKRMKEEVAHGCEELIGYWIADFGDNVKSYPMFFDIYKDSDGEYHVDIKYYKYFESHCNSFGSLQLAPGILSFYWSSEKLNVGKEDIVTILRAGVRGVSNSIIGELARSNTYSFGTNLLGSAGAMVCEVMVNSLIDNLSISKKSIYTMVGNINIISKNTLSTSLYIDEYKFRSDNTDVEKSNRQLTVDLIRCDFDNEYIKDNIAFITNNFLSQREPLSSKERNEFYKRHPEVRKAVRKVSTSTRPFKARRVFNREQLEKLKEYNQTH